MYCVHHGSVVTARPSSVTSATYSTSSNPVVAPRAADSHNTNSSWQTRRGLRHRQNVWDQKRWRISICNRSVCCRRVLGAVMRYKAAVKCSMILLKSTKHVACGSTALVFAQDRVENDFFRADGGGGVNIARDGAQHHHWRAFALAVRLAARSDRPEDGSDKAGQPV